MKEKNHKCCIVIPIYKSIPTHNETASLKQVLKILSDYHICFVCSYDFEPEYYINLTREHKNITFSINRFKTFYFSSIDGYNKLMLSIEFYKRFITFEFILIYQLDAWVFKNDLVYWCNQNFDYIGAPWFHKNSEGKLIFDGVGNGGFSLRKVKTHLKVLKSFSLIKKPGYFLYLMKKDKSFASLISSIKGVTLWNNTFFMLNDYEENEDKFWGIVAKRNFLWFNIPTPEIAKKFSVELFPSTLITSENTLPFGCHAWEKYEPEFWEKHIKI